MEYQDQQKYTSIRLKDFADILSLVSNNKGITYKMACMRKKTPFNNFRVYIIEKYDYDPDDKDMELIGSLIENGSFIKTFINPYFKHLDFKTLRLVTELYYYIKEYGWENKEVKSKASIKFNKTIVELSRLINKWSLFPTSLK